jgi:hypothetical protein
VRLIGVPPDAGDAGRAELRCAPAGARHPEESRSDRDDEGSPQFAASIHPSADGVLIQRNCRDSSAPKERGPQNDSGAGFFGSPSAGPQNGRGRLPRVGIDLPQVAFAQLGWDGERAHIQKSVYGLPASLLATGSFAGTPHPARLPMKCIGTAVHHLPQAGEGWSFYIFHAAAGSASARPLRLRRGSEGACRMHPP